MFLVFFPGILSSVWFILWMFFVSDSPTQHKRISKIERDYIQESLSIVTLSADKSQQDKVGNVYLYR